MAEWLATRRYSIYDIVQQCLNRISRLNDRYRAFISVFRDEALQEARSLDRTTNERTVTPLLGAPLAIKDNVSIKGHPTTAATGLFERFIPHADAQLIKELRRARTIILGKNNLHALALGTTSTSSIYGPVKNPFNHSRIAGGSSGGTAVAVALSMAAAGVGTDTGGSVRIPAAFCGLVGFKPTWGRVSLSGVIPLSPTLDHAGPITRTVKDALSMFNAFRGKLHDPSQKELETLARSPQEKPVMVAVARNYSRELVRKVERDFHQALERMKGLGIRMAEVNLPSPAKVHKARSIITLKEASIMYEGPLRREPEGFPSDVRKLLTRGSAIGTAAYLEALSFKAEVVYRLLEVFEKFDFVVTPTVRTVAPKAEDVQGKEQGAIRAALLTNTGLFNLTGMPAITLPMGGEHGLFTGLQLAAKQMDDLGLLRMAHLLEQHVKGRVRP